MDENEIIIHQTLEDQQDMTAVEQFAFKHDFNQLPPDANRYKQLIPKNTPGPGQQYAFEVNLDQCSGCKACITACHNENGLDIDETWRSVGLIHGETSTGPAIQHVTTACHHCMEPACLNGCPVKAYEKDKETGVVKHLDDQCIGCQYCILKCPYDVPKYSKKKGIVHKCDMCISRLKVGEAPACVRACPSSAIRITLVDTNEVKADPSQFVNIPQAPDSNYTKPTTRYITSRELSPQMASINEAGFKPEHPHMPLVVMLVLTQLSVGAFLMEGVMNHIMDASLRIMLAPVYVWSVLGVGILALVSSIFHLGRPQYAFRAILGIKTSWLSREILAFGAFAKLALVLAVQSKFAFLPSGATDILAYAVLVVGLFAVFTSVMVYRDTRRALWDSHLTTFKFFMTAAILGSLTVLAVSVGACAGDDALVDQVLATIGVPLVTAAAILSAFKILVEASLFVHLRRPQMTPMKKSAILMIEPLRKWTIQRFAYGAIGGILFPAVWLAMSHHMGITQLVIGAWLMLLVTLAGELLERYLFFRAVIALKMPQ